MSVSEQIKSAACGVRQGVDAAAAGAARVGRGTAAGFLGGLIASWMMNQYQAIESRPVSVRGEDGHSEHSGASDRQAARQKSEENGPAAKVARRVSRKLFDHEPDPGEKPMAGLVAHYGCGAAAGALYGGLSELIPMAGSGFGIPYATFIWLIGSEAANALGLSKHSTRMPAEKHASNLATHFVYGITLDISRRILRRML